MAGPGHAETQARRHYRRGDLGPDGTSVFIHTVSRVKRDGALRPNGRQAGTGAYTTWLERGQDQQLADAALALVVEHWRATDQDSWADTVSQHGWDAGCRHPDLAEAVAALRAAPGTAADLKAAIAIIDTALAAADGSTAPGWARLEARRAQLAGRLQRARSGRPTGEFDADGNPIYATPHHPVNPRRQRRPRFAEGPIDDRS